MTAPPAPPAAAADPIETVPVWPELDVPELKISRPLAPLVPALAVRMLSAPLVDVVRRGQREGHLAMLGPEPQQGTEDRTMHTLHIRRIIRVYNQGMLCE